MTSFELTLSYPGAWIILCFLFAAALSWLLYTRNYFGDDDRRWLRLTLGGLRIFFITILAFLLLEPLLKTSTREVEKPVIALGIDNSSSMVLNADSAEVKSKMQEAVSKIKEALADKYDLRPFLFGDRVRESDAPDYHDQVSNISDFIKSSEDKFENLNLGAVILFSDGIYNQGNNPLYNRRNLDAPIYAVALGDTVVKKDLLLKEVRHNQLAYLGNTFPIVASVEAYKLAGQKYVLKVQKDGKVLFQEEQTITGNQYRKETEIRLKADATGVQQYLVTVSPVTGEHSAANNRRNVFIDVLDGKNKILLLADAPHPDVNAIRQAIESNENYEVVVHFPFMGAAPELKGFNLLVLHQLPGLSQNFREAIVRAEEAAIPTFFVLGGESNIREFNRLAPGLGLQAGNLSMNQSLPGINKDFNLFTMDAENLNTLSRMPPLNTFYGKYTPVSPSNVLIYQKIGAVQTNDPMLAFFQNADKKTAVMYGDGFWRWRLYDFEKNENHLATNELMSRVVQYLAVKNDKRQFRIYPSQKTYTTNQRVTLEAELYNESYQLTNVPDVSVVVKDANKKEYTYNMGRTGTSYVLDAGFFKAGNYSFEARLNYNGKEVTGSGKFTVMPLELEEINTLADHNLLKTLAEKNGGKSFSLNQVDQLIEQLKANENIKSVSYLKTGFEDLINNKWLFFLLLAFISTEWFIRKWKGGY